jgi:SAM-dependent methyltransferase/methyltransferase-like protein
MTDALTKTYDELAYPNLCFPYTHPERLATQGVLHGMTPPSPAHCRVLDLGCGSGANLMYMASTLPGARLLGIDLSSRQIADGQRAAAALGLTNLELKTLSIMDLDERFGEFDYIICHGVYSWVPDAVQDKILAICKSRLAPRGVAYVGYNIYPGWHVGKMLREMIAFHDRPEKEFRERIARARELLDFLVEATTACASDHACVLKAHAEFLRSAPETYLFHEYLEFFNRAVFFHEFAANAQAKGLQFLCEAWRRVPFLELPTDAPAPQVSLPAGLIEREQYYDFIACQTFRRTLLCHDEVMIQHPPRHEVIERCLISGHGQPLDDSGMSGTPGAERFREIGGERVLTTSSSLLKAALHALFDLRPRAVSLDELLKLLSCAGTPGVRARGELAEAMLLCFSCGVVELHGQAPSCRADVSARPVAGLMARVLAEQGQTVLPSLHHRDVAVDPLHRLILCHLDGTRDRADLLNLLEEQAARGELVLAGDGAPVDDRQQLLDAGLRELARNGFLVG